MVTGSHGSPNRIELPPGPSGLHSDMERTLRLYRSWGYLCEVVERHKGMKRVDLFGFADVLAIGRVGILAIQSCKTADRAAHLRKLAPGGAAHQAALSWVRSGGNLEIIAWAKLLVKPGGKARRWYATVDRLNEQALLDGELAE